MPDRGGSPNGNERDATTVPGMSPSMARRAVALAGRPIDVVRRQRTGDPAAAVVALIYHRVGGRSQSPVDLPTAAFGAQLDEVGHRVMALDDALTALDGSAAVDGAATTDERADPALVITFDDGTADWLDVVLPALDARRLPATFYVSTEFVEQRRPFPDGGTPISWSGLAEMVASGLATIASHTHTHRVLAGVGARQAADELDRSIGLVEERLGVACRHFAYPKAVAGSAAADAEVRRRFASAALAGNRINHAGRTDPHRLGRHGLTVGDDPHSFRRKAAGGAWLEGWLRERRDARLAG